MKLKLIDFNNYKEGIEVQNSIFPNEDGTLNILASINRDFFIKITGIYYIDDHIKYYLAYLENEIVGITGIYYYNDRPKEAWIGWFGILAKYQKHGYGEMLLEETIKLAKENGFETIRLYADKEENNKAIKLYEKIGFIGEKYSKENLSYDCYIYSKSLNNKKVELWNNKNLNLSYQSELDQIDKNRRDEILEIYEKNLNTI